MSSLFNDGPANDGPPPATVPPVAWATCMVASSNVLNLALPGRAFYANVEPFTESEYQLKTGWLGSMIERLNADVLGLQEVWDEAALKTAVARSGLRYTHVLAPGAEQGAVGTPRVALVTRLALEAVESVPSFGPHDHVVAPELGPHDRFERPVLKARLRMKQGQTLHVLVAHLKSKRPKFLQTETGELLEDRDDPVVVTRATLRSLLMRAAEAAALRRIVIDVLLRTHEPLVLLGDLNDAPHSATSQLIAATGAAVHDRDARDVALYHALDVQSEPGLRREMGYSHVYQGWPEQIDQVWVSEEFVAASRFAIGDVRRVEYFNDHLHEGRDRWRSDHGFVRALLRVRLPNANA